MPAIFALVFPLSLAMAQAPESAKPPMTKAPAAVADALQIEKIATTASVENKEPVNPSSEFTASVGRVYCWTKVRSKSFPTTIKHVWSLNGQKVAEVSLAVKYPMTRTWSNKTIAPGQWKVDVTDEAGNTITTTAFTVAAASAQPKQ